MKKHFLTLLVSVFLIVLSLCPQLFADEMAGPVQAGAAASVKGEVKATTPPEKTARSLKDGDEIFMGDKIETGADGQLKIMLLDETVFSLGSSSSVTIDEFIYDPKNAGEKSSVMKGVFRAVSSKMTQKKPENVPEDEPSTVAEAQESALKLEERLANMDAESSVSKPSKKS